MTNSSGVLYIWCAKSTDNKEHITPLLINAGIYYRYIYYKEGTIPSFSIDAEKDVVLALGGESKSPLQELKNYGLVKKNLTLASSRGIIYTLPCGVKCLTSYTALVRNVQYDLFVELQGDIKLAIRLLTTGSLIPPLLDFQWVDDFTEVIAAIDKHQFKWNSTKLADVAIDLETTGLIPYNPKTWIVTFQISTDEKSARVVKFADDFQPTKPENYTDLEYDASNCKNRKELLWVQINKLLNDQRVSLKGANLKFDLGWITEKWGIKCTNFRFDTLLVGSLLDENRSNSLKVHAFIYTPFGNYESDVFKKYNIAEPHKIPDDVLLPYCGYDTTVCLQVARKMKEELAINTKTYTNTNLRKFYTNILHPAARAYERVESTGVLVDKKYYLDFKKELEEKLESNLAKAHKYLPGRLISKFRDPKEPIKSVSLARAAMIADYMFGKQWLNLKPVMFTPKSTDENPKPSTALEHFLKFENDPSVGEFVKILKEYKDIAKTLSTYIDGFLADLRYDDRFHASFFMHRGNDNKAKDSGTVTGRLSIKGPALQCLKGDSLVLTDKGEIPIKVIVEQCEKGEKYKVLTHTGKWQDVIGSYRNGVQPLLKITTASGLFLECTKNHPWLTDLGFIQAGKLQINDQVWRLPNAQEKRDNPRNCLPQINSYTGSRTNQYTETISLSVSVRGNDNSSYVPFNKWGDKVLRLFKDRTANYSWSYVTGLSIPNVPFLSKHAATLLQPQSEVLQRLWWAWDNCMSGVAGFFSNVSKGYGGETGRFNFGTVGSESGVFTPQLQMGYTLRTEPQYAKQRMVGNGWRTQNTTGLGKTVWDNFHNAKTTISKRVELDSGTYHSLQALKAGFKEDYIKSIEEMPAEETFDLTIDKCHSFIVDKLIVHNTIPKKTRWSKPLRRAFIAPKDHVILSADYSQGELKILADLSQEPKMLWAYNNGLDLHAVTGAGLLGVPVDEFMSYNESGDPKLQKLYDENRQKAKGCIAKGQLVLTDKGEVPIELVTTDMLVFDGNSWVKHEGVIYQGYELVITYQGLTATPDHIVCVIELDYGVTLEYAKANNFILKGTPSFISKEPYVSDIYDIVNAGVNHRFMVSNVIVHNCNFGLCVAEDSLVLTNIGLVKIQDVKLHHLVWDGVDYVKHDGLIYKGIKDVITYQGLTATSDHIVWVNETHKLTLMEACFSNLNLAKTGNNEKPILLSDNKHTNYSILGKGKSKVYDLLNAGKNHRFTCSNVLVSNCYGMGAEGFRIYAETAYKVIMTLKEAEFYRDKFFETYQGLEPWYAKVKSIAKSQGYIDSPLGRRRHLPLLNSTDKQVASKELRVAINSPVQGSLSDFSLWATAIAEKEGITEKAPVVLMVHDQLVAYLPKDNWVYYAKRYRDIMENLPFNEFGWVPKVKFTVDVEIGMGDPEKGIPPNLAQLTKASKLCKDWNN